MGMPVGIDVRRPAVDPGPVLDRCYALLRRADDVFSLWRRDTPMSRYAAGAAGLEEVPPEIAGVLALAHLARLRTGGWFAARRPDGTPDPTGIVKGWAVARVADALDAAGLTSWCVNAAGDVCVRGAPAPGRPWHVGIADPRRPGAVADVVAVGGAGRAAVATSGAAERGPHIWDPFTGRPAAADPLSVSVVCADPVRADVLATAAVARGPSCVAWLDAEPGVEALAIAADGAETRTRGWPRGAAPA
ncbi:MAG TPA: FAD:protein FMN transferase [Streptosporangiaceae bacterium]